MEQGSYGSFQQENTGEIADPSTVTLIQSNRLDGTTRGWAVSAMVLGAIYLLMTVASALLNTGASARIMGSSQIMSSTLLPLIILNGLCHMLIPCAFIAAGTGVLHRVDRARKSLRMAGALGIAASILGFVILSAMFSNPTLMSQILAQSANRAALYQTVQQEHAMIQAVTHLCLVMVGVFSLVQIVYCALLYRQMGTRAAQVGMRS